MKAHGLNLAEGGVITNLTMPKGTSFPSNPNDGELFCRTDLDATFTYSETDVAWVQLARITSGTWTPVLTGSTQGEIGPGHTALGTWTKVGNKVTLWFLINLDNAYSTSTPYSGDITITGNPFTAAGISGMRYSVTLGSYENISGVKGAYVEQGSSAIKLVVLGNTTSATESNMTHANIGSSPGICGWVEFVV